MATNDPTAADPVPPYGLITWEVEGNEGGLVFVAFGHSFDAFEAQLRRMSGAEDGITDALSTGSDVELRNFGVFEVRLTKSRVGRNPNKPEHDVVIPARATVKFKSGKIMRQRVLLLGARDLDGDHVVERGGADGHA